jgi:protein-S-isoprenylcysteine O-methyltransferase Ste14
MSVGARDLSSFDFGCSTKGRKNMTMQTDRTTRTTPATGASPMGGAFLAGIVALVVNLIVTWVVAMIFPTADLGWALTLVAITSFFAGFFGYYGAFRQATTVP